MAFIKKTWHIDDVVKPEDANRWEDGIQQAITDSRFKVKATGTATALEIAISDPNFIIEEGAAVTISPAVDMTANTGVPTIAVNGNTPVPLVLADTDTGATGSQFVPMLASRWYDIVFNGNAWVVANLQWMANDAQNATKLKTARQLTAALNTATPASFDGTANAAIGVTGVLRQVNGGTGTNNMATIPTEISPNANNTLSLGNTLRMWRNLLVANLIGQGTTGPRMVLGTPGSAGNAQIIFRVAGDSALGVGLGIVNTAGVYTLSPLADGRFSLGTSAYKWGQIYSTSGTINTSDRTKKKEIKKLSGIEVKALIEKLPACSYKMKDGESGRTHYGFIAQDLERVMHEIGMNTKDFAGFIKAPKAKRKKSSSEDEFEMIEEVIPGEYDYGLRYEEFIPILWKHNQMLEKRLAKLEKILEDKGE